MGKKASGTTYVSKGQRPSVQLANAVRRDGRANGGNMRSIFAKAKHREDVLAKHGNNAAKEKILEQDRIETLASQLFETYESAGITWAACVQAVKTDFVSELHQKWANRLGQAKKES